MTYRIEFHSFAKEEFRKSYKWYEKQQEGLGERFVTYINKGLDEILDDPERYAKKKGNYREFIVDVFPFVIVYEFLKKEEIIFVSHIFHSKRNPALKYKR